MFQLHKIKIGHKFSDMENTTRKNLLKKRVVLIFILLGFSVLSIYPINAHFVCGKVLNSPDNVSASWFPVRIYYPSNPLEFTTCQVSPQNNKYCCDAEAISHENIWKIGDVVSAEIYDPSLIYVARPVSVTTTGQGYDVFPEMQIRKVINIHSPNETLVLSNKTILLLNASFLMPYTSITFRNETGNYTLCNNCINISKDIKTIRGYNSWKIFATGNSRTFSQVISFFLVKNFSFNRFFDCKKCRGKVVPYGKNINVTLSLNLSSPVYGLQLTEFVPPDFYIINVSGISASYDNFTNEIKWNVSGSSKTFSYLVKSPDFKLFSRESFCKKSYTFKTELEGEEINSENISMKKFFKFCSIQKKRVSSESFKGVYGGIYHEISPHNPYVLKSNGSLQKVAFFPKQTFKNVRFSIINLTEDIPYEKLRDAIGYYLVQSNLGENSIDHTYVDFRINKSQVPKGGVSFFSYDNGWKSQKFTLYKQDNNSFYFHGFFTGNALAVVKNSGEFNVISMFKKIMSIFSLRSYLYFGRVLGVNVFTLFARGA